MTLPTIDGMGVFYCTECGHEQLHPLCGAIRQVYMPCTDCNSVHPFFLDKDRLIEFWKTQRVALSIMIEEMGGTTED